MHIVHVVRQFHPAVGGIESGVLELATTQVAAGHSVCIVTLNRLFNAPAQSRLPPRDSTAGAKVVRIPFVGSSRYPIAPSVLRHLAKADIVHVHGIDFFCDFLAWTKPVHRKRLVISTHGGFFHTQFAVLLKHLYFATVTRLSLNWYDAVVAGSIADRELFGRIRKRGLECIESGVNISKFADASSVVPANNVLALGRFSSNKRLDRLITFVAALRRRDPRWRLIIAGRKWDLDAEALRALAQAQQIVAGLEIVPDPSDHTVRQLMARCSVIASASEYEGFGLVAVEGMSAGLFPLLSDIPAFRRLLERTGVGMLGDFADAETTAERFSRRWAEIEDNYAELRARSMQAASQYDWRHVGIRYAQVYENICGFKRRSILGVPINSSTPRQTAELLDASYECDDSSIVAFANAHALNIAAQNRRFREVLRRSIVINDGIGVDIASRILFGSNFPHNLNGTDFIPYYLHRTRHQYRIFLLGGAPGIAQRAGEYFSAMYPQHRIIGWHHGYFADRETATVVEIIRAAKADIILVGMGNPRQELWLADNLAATGCRLGFAVGALFAFVTGDARRAPAWARYARLEWLHRLAQEPGRLWRRYLIGGPLFVLRVLAQWVAGRPEDASEVT